MSYTPTHLLAIIILFHTGDCAEDADVTFAQSEQQVLAAEAAAQSEKRVLADIRTCTCPTGSYECISCNAGKYGPDGSICSDCETGKYQEFPHQTNCVECPSGKYQDYTGQTYCNSNDICLSGQYWDVSYGNIFFA